jgi:hypothetical protein
MASITSDHIAGFVVGLGAAALGFYVYKKNQSQIDEWLKSQGINMPEAGGKKATNMSMEELVAEKEKMEDLIAEREMAEQGEPAAEATK